MRVIGGEFRSRRLKTLPGGELRPTPDRLRETLFDVLGPRVEGSVFLDAYAGSGAVGIEALSRGAARAIFLERHRAAADTIRANLAALDIASRAEVIQGPAAASLARHRAGLVFLDPPYDLEREYALALDILKRVPPAVAIVQHDTRLTLAEAYGALRRYRSLKQGDNVLSFFAPC